jgi:hypothetical protein
VPRRLQRTAAGWPLVDPHPAHRQKTCEATVIVQTLRGPEITNIGADSMTPELSVLP